MSKNAKFNESILKEKISVDLTYKTNPQNDKTEPTFQERYEAFKANVIEENKNFEPRVHRDTMMNFASQLDKKNMQPNFKLGADLSHIKKTPEMDKLIESTSQLQKEIEENTDRITDTLIGLREIKTDLTKQAKDFDKVQQSIETTLKSIIKTDENIDAFRAKIRAQVKNTLSWNDSILGVIKGASGVLKAYLVDNIISSGLISTVFWFTNYMLAFSTGGGAVIAATVTTGSIAIAKWGYDKYFEN